MNCRKRSLFYRKKKLAVLVHVFFHWIWWGVMSDNSQEHRNVLAGFAFVNFISPLVRNLPDAMGNPGCWGDNLELQIHFGLPIKYMITIWSSFDPIDLSSINLGCDWACYTNGVFKVFFHLVWIWRKNQSFVWTALPRTCTNSLLWWGAEPGVKSWANPRPRWVKWSAGIFSLRKWQRW